MTRTWKRLEAALKAHPDVLASLNPPAREADLKALGPGAPEDWVASARIHDGQAAEALLDPWRLLPAREVADERARLQHLLRAGEFDGCETEHDRKVRDGWWRAGWWPVAANGAGDLLVLDLDPGPKGKPGQVVEFVHDDPVRRVVAPSLGKWLDLAAKADRAPDAPGAPVVVEEAGERHLFRDAKAAQKRCVRGDWRVALRGLEAFAARGDGAARGSVMILQAYLGEWDRVLELGVRVVLDRETFRALNVRLEAAALLARAGAETGRWKELAALAPRVEAGVAGERLARCARERADVFGFPFGLEPEGDDAENARAWAAYEAQGVPATYSETPASRRRHRLLMALRHDRRDVAEELVAAHPECCEFGDALRMARWGPPDVAWSRLVERLPTWRPVEYAQVAPVELLTHRPVRGWMTRARCEQLLATPRASWWWEPRAPRA